MTTDKDPIVFNGTGTESDKDANNGAVINQQNDAEKEALAEGAKQFAANIVEIADKDPEAVDAYLKDILTDTSGKSPNERMAAFHFLEREQEREIDISTIKAGEKMLGSLEKDDREVGREFTRKSVEAKTGIDKAIYSHTTEVGKHFRGNKTEFANPGKVAISNDGAEIQVKSGFRKMYEPVGMVASWAQLHARIAGEFLSHNENSKQHKKALKEAGETTKPGYKGSPKDLTNVIDNSIVEKTSKQLVIFINDVRSRSKSPETAIAQVVLMEPSKKRNEAIAALVQSAEQISGRAKVGAGTIQGMLDEAVSTVGRFLGRSEDYRRAPNPNSVPDSGDLRADDRRRKLRESDIDDIYMGQKRRLTTASDQSKGVLDYGDSLIKISKAMVLDTQQKMAYIKAKDSKK